jgi:hypothetical protein
MRQKWVNLEKLGIPSGAGTIEEFVQAVIDITGIVFNLQGSILPQLFLVIDQEGKIAPIVIAPQSVEETQYLFEAGYAKETALKLEAKIKETSPISELVAYLLVGYCDLRIIPKEVAEQLQSGQISLDEVRAQIKPRDILSYLLVEKSTPHEPKVWTYEVKGQPPHATFQFIESGPREVAAQSRSLLHLWGE